MFSLISNKSKSLDEPKHVLGFFFDLSKALDMVNHRLPLNKIKHFAVRDNAISWMPS